MYRTSLLCFAMVALTAATAATDYPPTAPEVAVMGRYAPSENDDAITLAFPGVEIAARFKSQRILLLGETLSGNAHFNVELDGEPLPQVDLATGPFAVTLAEGLDPNKEHRIRIVRRSEAWQGVVRIDALRLDADGVLLDHDTTATRRILCIGDSITGGEGADLKPPLAKGSQAANAEAAFGWQLAKDLNAEVHLVSYGGKGLVRDWQGLESEITAPEFFERALPDNPESVWDHTRFEPDLIIIGLGTNDFSQGIVPAETFIPAYVEFIDRLRSVHPRAKVLLLSAPWFGDGDPKQEALNKYIHAVVDHFALKGSPEVQRHFFTETYLGTELDMHPTAEQHRAMADSIADTLRGWLSWQ